jgi:hypothetical protein
MGINTIDGKKICGNAQAYADERVMHHGCLLFNTDLTVLSKALEPSKETVGSKGVKSVRSRVDNIFPHLKEKITVHEFADKILEEMIRKITCYMNICLLCLLPDLVRTYFRATVGKVCILGADSLFQAITEKIIQNETKEVQPIKTKPGYRHYHAIALNASCGNRLPD